MVTLRSGKDSQNTRENSGPNEPQHGTPAAAVGQNNLNATAKAKQPISVEIEEYSNLELMDEFMSTESVPEDQQDTGGISGAGLSREELRLSPVSRQRTPRLSRRSRRVNGGTLESSKGRRNDGGDEAESEDDNRMEAMISTLMKQLKGEQGEKKSGAERQAKVNRDDSSTQRGKSEQANYSDTAWTVQAHPIALQSLSLPVLDSKLDLESHLCMVEQILEERGYLQEGSFNPRLRASAASLVIESMKGLPEVLESAKALHRQGLQWSEFRATLVKEFGSRHHLLDELESRMRSLTFKKPYSTFISEIKSIHNLNRRIYADEEDRRRLVQNVIRSLPANIAKGMIDRLLKIDVDFERVQFDMFISNLEMILVSKEALERYHPSITERRSPLGVNQIQENDRWQENWCKQFRGVLFCSGIGHEDELNRLCMENKEIQVKFIPRGRKGPFAMLGYNSDSPPQLACYNRPFRWGRHQDESRSKSKNW
jgi:hypothetical protein